MLGGNGGKKGVERDVGWVWEVSNKIWKGFGGASTRLGGAGMAGEERGEKKGGGGAGREGTENVA